MEQPSWIKQTLSGRYRIEALLGQGGMSAVYKASDPNLKRVVAIKLIHPHLATDSNFIIRFEDEASAVAKLRHPNIVQVFDFNTDGDVHYMVLEFIPGETLQDRLRRLNKAGRSLAIEDAIKFTINICDAIGYAHKQGIIHRDIKPANIMLDVHGQAILMDFGIVKIIGGDHQTATGAVVGTARYMSPETIRAELPDQRSDIYSLGITLFEMLNGEPPFNSDSAMSLMMMHLNDPVPDLHSIKPNVPPELASILQRSLEKDPNRRYSSAGEMAAELKKVLAKLEGLRADPEASAPASKASSTYRDETQIESSDLEEAPRERVIEQKTDSARKLEPQEFIDMPTRADASISENVIRTTVPVQPQPASTQERSQTPINNTPVVKKSRLPLLLGLGAGGFLLLLILIGVIFVVGKNLVPGVAGSLTDTPVVSVPPASTKNVVIAVVNTPTKTKTPTTTLTPTSVPTATSTMPPYYVRINNISLNSSNYYVVDYETFGYTEVLPGRHVHFFFNTVTPAQAGVPGNGPWVLHGGPRPFTYYSVSDRPGNATQMCALVANSDHSIILDSGNCYYLP